MPAKFKRKQQAMSEEDSDIDFNGKEGENIDVEFDFRNMSDGDYHGIKSLVSQLAHGSLAPLTTIADIICEQVNIGCVVTTGDSEAGVCAFGTIINMKQHASNPGLVAINTLMKEIAKKTPRCVRSITHILSNDQLVVGLVLKERLINFPPELAPNIHKVLHGDVEWSRSDDYEPDEGESRSDYAFTTLLFLSTFEVEASGKPVEDIVDESGNHVPNPERDLGHKKKRKLEKKSMSQSRIYHHWEDELLVEKALFSHAWQNSSKPPVLRGAKKYSSYSILYAIKWDDYVAVVDELGNIPM